jgi:2-oxoisovalerate dehydrogenase E1 component
VKSPWPEDAIVVCSFGDASANHSTATGAINSACHTAHQGLPLPLLFVCEDNGIGISVPTPAGWIAQAYGARPALRYFRADGGDLASAHVVVSEAVAFVRARRRPAFLHLETVRLLGHAGSDLEIAYRTAAQIREAEARDPLTRAAALLVREGVATPDEILARYEAIRARVREVALAVEGSPHLRDAADVMGPLAPSRPELVLSEMAHIRSAHFGDTPPSEGDSARPLTLAESINATLAELLDAYPELLVFGEDVGKKGGVYGVTRGLQRRAGVARVFDTLLDEQSILGLGLGAGLAGYLPIPEIQYLAYLHNAIDQIRGEAASQSFFSQGAFQNPLVVRVAGLAYQKGFGGHFHNDNAIASLRDIPGLIVAIPSMPDDGARMLRTCVAAAKVDGRVAIFLEPIALYHTRDLHAAGDQRWLAPLPPPSDHVPLGRARVHGDGGDLTIVTFGNGVFMSARVAARLEAEGARVRIVDLRWISPLPETDLIEHARATGKVLVVDETRRSGGVSEAIFASLVDRGFSGAMRRVASRDSFIPLGPAAEHVLLGEDEITRAAREMLG